jgi:hypothetical protein
MTFDELCAEIQRTPLSHRQKVALRRVVQSAPRGISHGRPIRDHERFPCGHTRIGKECQECHRARSRKKAVARWDSWGQR